MCDTIVVPAELTEDGVTLFAKNSDREPNEAQYIEMIPSADNADGSTLTCTYIEIPQVAHTHAVILSRPFWMWGAEMGVNECGVAIGNEAVFSKVPAQREPALLGMDLLRLALERADSARGAVEVITQLLEQHGQGGNCGFRHPFYYHNSFLIADPAEAWLLETVGRQWAARRIRELYAISNGLTIDADWDMASSKLVSDAPDRRWFRRSDGFDFARCYSDRIYTRLSDSRRRRSCTMASIRSRLATRKVGVSDLMTALRDHGDGAGAGWGPDRGIVGATVCMHAGYGPVRASQTTGSWVSHLDGVRPVHFVTAAAAPCTALFKPLWMDTPLPDLGPVPSGTYEARSRFWRHELLHRAVLRDYPARIGAYVTERDALERTWVAKALGMSGAPFIERAAFVAEAFVAEQEAEARWIEAVTSTRPSRQNRWHYRRAWNRFNQEARMPRER